MRIALDAMGGDRAPSVPIEGAIMAASELQVQVVLVGNRDLIKAELAKQRASDLSFEVVDASEVIGMDEHPVAAAKHKRDSSIAVGLNMLKSGQAEAFVSAGNSGAVMAAALFTLGRVPGIERPALSVMAPSVNRPFLLLDMGANMDCKPQYLAQFATMGSLYMEKALGVSRPSVALLSIGEEPGKGNALTQEAFALIRASSLNFIGNVEGKDLPFGPADVVVTDGFVGNVVIKLGEGFYEAMFNMLKEELSRDVKSRFAALLLLPTFRRLKRRLDYAEYGGAPLLGVAGTCIVAHGRSNARAIRSALRVARDAAQQDIVGAISRGVTSTRQ